jgi:NAD-dependent dihydropyrimidine dehydrogenase PreA subunit
MIELVFEDLCTACGACEAACPSHVFDLGADGKPVIARQDQCQTCFLCELYCEADALYVGPDQTASTRPDPETVRASGHLGQMRRDQGWNQPGDPDPLREYWKLGPLLGRGAEIAAERYAKANPDWTKPPPRTG